jgi:uncharacterized membrane-anchored protein
MMTRRAVVSAQHVVAIAVSCQLLSPLVYALVAQRATDSPFARIQWAEGPVKGQLGKVGEVGVPGSCRFTGAQGSKLFMEATENPPTGRELGVIICPTTGADGGWFVVFTHNTSGYVKDDERSSLDGDAILKSLQRGTEAGNEERRRRGWEEFELVRWEIPPFYDTVTNNLTWSTLGRSKASREESINHSVRLLGREGVMHVDLVASPGQLREAVPIFNAMISNYSYLPGHRYAEWREGDKIAAYGLTALIAGGAGVAATKLGFFGKAWKLILAVALALKKLILVVLLGAAAAAKTVVQRIKDRTAAKNAQAAGGGAPTA